MAIREEKFLSSAVEGGEIRRAVCDSVHEGPYSTPPALPIHSGFGTRFIVDPRENLVVIFLTQRSLRSPDTVFSALPH